MPSRSIAERGARVTAYAASPPPVPPTSSAARAARATAGAVSRVLPGPLVAMSAVSLTIEPGEFVALSGPSGSGKPSLLSLIGALDQPTSGNIEVDGVAV